MTSIIRSSVVVFCLIIIMISYACGDAWSSKHCDIRHINNNINNKNIVNITIKNKNYYYKPSIHISKEVLNEINSCEYSDILKNAECERTKEFLQKAIPLAIEIQQKYGIPSSAILSMACFESAYGKSQLAKQANNYFGIKALGNNWSGNVMWTYTTDSGNRHQQPFRQYANMRESFVDYALFLRNQQRYECAFKTKNGKEFVSRVLNAGYCPDSFYIGFICKIINRYNLKTLDNI